MASPDKQYYEKLVYDTLYPRSDSKDPSNWEDFVRKLILKEVRWENVRYYGNEKTRAEELDALYPGHDYASPVARLRLGQFHTHRRLFAAFDQLRLKPSEIHMLCTWEGTKSARDLYEEQRGVKIVDTMWHSQPAPAARRAPRVTHHHYGVPLGMDSVLSQDPFTPPRRQTHMSIDYYANPAIWGFQPALDPISSASSSATTVRLNPSPSPASSQHMDLSGLSPIPFAFINHEGILQGAVHTYFPVDPFTTPSPRRTPSAAPGAPRAARRFASPLALPIAFNNSTNSRQAINTSPTPLSRTSRSRPTTTSTRATRQRIFTSPPPAMGDLADADLNARIQAETRRALLAAQNRRGPRLVRPGGST